MNPDTNSYTPELKTFVLLPGAWSGSWSWEPIRDRLARCGHRVHAVDFSGLHPHGDVSRVDLQTHVNDTLTTLARHELTDVVLVGHSYSGLVAGLVTDQAPHRIAHTVYVHGFLAQQGQSLLDSFPAEQRAQEIAEIEAHDGWWPPPSCGGHRRRTRPNPRPDPMAGPAAGAPPRTHRR